MHAQAAADFTEYVAISPHLSKNITETHMCCKDGISRLNLNFLASFITRPTVIPYIFKMVRRVFSPGISINVSDLSLV